MAKRPTLSTLASGFRSSNKLNENFSAIDTAFDNTISRDGSTPNTMLADFDLNGNKVINAAAATQATDLVRLQELQTYLSQVNGLIGNEYLSAITGAVLRPLSEKLGDLVAAKDFGVVADGVTDDTEALQAAVDGAQGRPILLPEGVIVITSTITYSPALWDSAFGSGLKVYGQGKFVTFIDNQSGTYAFSLTTGSDISTFEGAVGGLIADLSIIDTTASTTSSGIFISSNYDLRVVEVHIKGLGLHGVHVPTILGDNDASNMLLFEHLQIYNCGGWGIKADGDSGNNELSFLCLFNSKIQGCGTTSADAVPPSGGMIWKGQILLILNSGFAVNENVGLFIPGADGSAQCVDMQSTAFENNKKRHFYTTGCSHVKARNIQFYNNDTFTATVQCEFDAPTYVVRDVDIDGVTVRATSGNNPLTAFKLSGTVADKNSCRVRNVTWENFDHAGQTRFDGWLFDYVPMTAELIVASGTSLLLRPHELGTGATTPLRLRYSPSGTSTTGEWIEYKIPAGGFTVDNSGLAADTTYYVYVYAIDSTIPLADIEVSATGWALDATSSYPVKTGDATRLYVGRVRTNGSAEFTATDIAWVNPLNVPLTSGGSGSMWSSATGVLRFKNSAAAPISTDDATYSYYPIVKNFVFGYDPPSVAAGASATLEVAVTCASNDAVAGIAFAPGWGGLVVTGSVKTDNVVTGLIHNPTGSAVDLAPSTMYIYIMKNG